MANKISAVIITYNEEKNIGRCLDSIQEVADECIVVDSYSTDKTVDISKEKGAKTCLIEWKGYAATKNEANQTASYEYILSIDADEAFSEPLKQSVLYHKQQGLKGIYECKRLTNYCGKWIRHGGWYPDKKVRLFPKDSTKWTGHYVHETLEFKGAPQKTLLQGDLLHYSFYSVQDHYRRIDKYAELEARKKLSKRKKHVFLPMFLSPVLTFLKMYVFKLGFLDGYYGFVIARISGYANYRKYKALKRLVKENT